MARKFPSTPQSIYDLLIRRKWWFLTPLLIVPVIVFLIGLRLPKQYESTTVILVDPQKIPTDYVKSVVVSDVTQRLQTIKEEVMSRTRLQRIAEELGLYSDVRNKQGMGQVVNAMRKDIDVEIIKGSDAQNPVDGFKITYATSTPEMAQKVTQKIASLFIAENLRVRDQEAQGTSLFINDQLAKAKQDLEMQEDKIRAFKAAHMGTLPEQETSNLSLISQYQSEAQANSEAIDRANQQLVYLRSMLNMNGTSKDGTTISVESPLEMQLARKQDELAAARQKYTDSHPDVVRLKGEVASLEQAIKHEGTGAKSIHLGGAAPSVTQQFESQMMATQQEIKSRTAKQSEIEAQLNRIQGNVETLPAVQGAFEDLNRDYQSMQKNYDSLLEKQQASGMAAELEKHDDSESFRILDPANLPGAPSAPNLLVINGAGLFGGLILGLLLAVAVDMKDATIHTIEEVTDYIDLPMIVALPTLTREMRAAVGLHTERIRITR